MPLGLLVAIYITEYGGSRFATPVRFLIDVMTGIPSIVAGLFVLAFWLIALDQGYSGFAGAMALAIIELPIVVRTSEEMIRLVPGALREASYALGIPKWRTIVRVVLPDRVHRHHDRRHARDRPGHRRDRAVCWWSATTTSINGNPFSGDQASLPVYIFQNAQSSSSASTCNGAWAAALTLIPDRHDSRTSPPGC